MKEKGKRIEMRLNEPKRQGLKVGDTIDFINTQTQEVISARILNLYRYKSFDEVYKVFPKKDLGYGKFEKADPEDMLRYYPKEKIEKYGALAIEIELL